MERITKFWKGMWIVDTSKGADRNTALSRLAEYENTDLTPEQISLREDDIKLASRENKEYREEILKLRKEIADYRDAEEQGYGYQRIYNQMLETQKQYQSVLEEKNVEIQLMQSELREYHNAEKRGQLIMFPCKIGDMTYTDKETLFATVIEAERY